MECNSFLSAGSASVRITPPVGIPLDGYGIRDKPSKGVHDHLKARTLILSDDETFISLISLELLYVPYQVAETVHRVAQRELGIPEDSVLLAAVHTHSGPSVLGIHSCMEEQFTDEYVSLLSAYVSQALISAYNNMQKARISFAKGMVRNWTINRRRPLDGITDEEVITMGVEDTEGRSIASVVNFTCHAVVLGPNNLMVSADYPGYVSRIVESVEKKHMSIPQWGMWGRKSLHSRKDPWALLWVPSKWDAR